jgi:hypothetical protein
LQENTEFIIRVKGIDLKKIQDKYSKIIWMSNLKITDQNYKMILIFINFVKYLY